MLPFQGREIRFDKDILVTVIFGPREAQPHRGVLRQHLGEDLSHFGQQTFFHLKRLNEIQNK
jgi:hypothetical protein